MAYENGTRINRYAAKMEGKRRHQGKTDKTAYDWWRCSSKEWKRYYLSNCRKFCKLSTNRRIRQGAECDNHGGYRKTFDYWWTLF